MESFQTERIVPDVIANLPKKILEVKYDGNEIKPGCVITPAQVKTCPNFKWEHDPSKFYVLAMIDPDAPSRRFNLLGEVRHYLVVNIPGDDLSQGQVLSEYRGSGPPKWTGLHRYVFLVYEQPNKVEFSEGPNDSRMRFSVKKFAEKYSLGDPVAGNFFKAEWDETVPTILERIGVQR